MKKHFYYFGYRKMPSILEKHSFRDFDFSGLFLLVTRSASQPLLITPVLIFGFRVIGNPLTRLVALTWLSVQRGLNQQPQRRIQNSDKHLRWSFFKK